MKIDRRCFLAFIIGGAAGTALSPLPWKITDDFSIWSQNWPWTPVPTKGEVSFVTSTCTLCPGGCGISVRKVDERVVKVEGLKGHPVNDGGLCILGLSAAQLLYAPTRVRGPLKKVDGAWREIAWGQAIKEIAATLAELRAKGQPQSVAWISDSDRGTVAELCKRFLTVFGSPNYLRTPSIQDVYETALYLTQGQRAMAGFDVAQADFVLSFSSGLIEGWGSPVYMFRSRNVMRQNGGRISQVEPRLSKTAAKADQWMPITPGSEGALALGLAHVIIAEGLYRKDFIDSRCSGFDAFKQVAGASYAPEAVSRLTGIAAQAIVDLAKAFAGAKKPLAVCGRGSGRIPGGLQEVLAVHYLNALTGSINQPGGVIAVPEPEFIDWPEPEMDAVASQGVQQPRLDGAGRDSFPLARYLLNRLPEALAAGTSAPVQALFVSGANPALQPGGHPGRRQGLRQGPADRKPVLLHGRDRRHGPLHPAQPRPSRTLRGRAGGAGVPEADPRFVQAGGPAGLQHQIRGRRGHRVGPGRGRPRGGGLRLEELRGLPQADPGCCLGPSDQERVCGGRPIQAGRLRDARPEVRVQ